VKILVMNSGSSTIKFRIYGVTDEGGGVGRPREEPKLIICHLGSGASITAVTYGRSVETSMGMTPLVGLVMGTRCGDLDPSLFPLPDEVGDLGADSITTIELVAEMEGAFGIEIPDRGADRSQTVGQAIQYVVERLRAAGRLK